jgi:heterodisulfide reductase subunit B
MKFEEISKELNIPLWKVKNIYFSGINKLKERIQRDRELRKKLDEILKELNEEDININYREILTTILYDNYGKDKYL